MAYYLEGIKELPKQFSKNMVLKYTSSEFSETTETMVFLVANSKSVGGFPTAAPLASVSDGYLDVLILKKIEFLTTPDLIVKWLQGQPPKSPVHRVFSDERNLCRIQASTDNEVAIDYDGEILSEGLPVRISIVPEALNILVQRQDPQ